MNLNPQTNVSCSGSVLDWQDQAVFFFLTAPWSENVTNTPTKTFLTWWKTPPRKGWHTSGRNHKKWIRLQIMGLKTKNISKSSTETKTHVSGISKGSFEIIMGWPHNLSVYLGDFHIFMQWGEKKTFWAIVTKFLKSHQIKSTITINLNRQEVKLNF